MKKSNQPKKNKLSIPRVKISGIKPFTQQPSVNKYEEKQPGVNTLKASDLFSRFTADIIKEDVLFTR